MRQFSDEILYTRLKTAIFQRLYFGMNFAVYNGIEKTFYIRLLYLYGGILK